MAKRLYRSQENRIIAGVCGGLGEYFDIDPVLIRIINVILIFPGGIGLIAYIVAWIAMPLRPDGDVVVESGEPQEKSDITSYLPGLILVVVGLIFLGNRIFWWFNFSVILPLGLITLGVILIAKAITKHREERGNNDSVET